MGFTKIERNKDQDKSELTKLRNSQNPKSFRALYTADFSSTNPMPYVDTLTDISERLARDMIARKELLIKTALSRKGKSFTNKYIIERCRCDRRGHIETYFCDDVPFLEIENEIICTGSQMKTEMRARIL